MKRLEVKKALKVLVLVVAALTMNKVAFGSGNIEFSSINESEKVLFSAEQLDSKSIKVSIEDISNALVYFEQNMHTPSKFKKVFNVSQMPNGKYTLIVKTGSSEIEKEFSIADGKLEKETTKAQFKPYIKRLGEAILVFHENKNQEKLEINFKSDSDTFFSYETENKEFSKLCNISKLEAGDYAMEVIAGKENYTYFFEVK